MRTKCATNAYLSAYSTFSQSATFKPIQYKRICTTTNYHKTEQTTGEIEFLQFQLLIILQSPTESTEKHRRWCDFFGLFFVRTDTYVWTNLQQTLRKCIINLLTPTSICNIKNNNSMHIRNSHSFYSLYHNKAPDYVDLQWLLVESLNL